MLIHEDIEAVFYSFTKLDWGLGELLLIDYCLAALLEDVGGDSVAEDYVHDGRVIILCKCNSGRKNIE
jgi:hypothetical protein